MEVSTTPTERHASRVRCHQCFNYVSARQKEDGSLSVRCPYCHTLMMIRTRNKTALIKLVKN